MEVVIKSKEVQLLDDGVCILARYNELGQIIISKNERKKAKLEPILFIVFWGSIFFSPSSIISIAIISGLLAMIIRKNCQKSVCESVQDFLLYERNFHDSFYNLKKYVNTLNKKAMKVALMNDANLKLVYVAIKEKLKEYGFSFFQEEDWLPEVMEYM